VPDWLIFLLALLGTYRLAHMIAMEDGPFDAFSAWRDKVGQSSWVGRGLHCPLCLSFWLALPMALAWQVSVISWLGIAGGCLVLHLALYGTD
jgi:hypothetical protein